MAKSNLKNNNRPLKVWNDYDKYNRITWPSNQAGVRMYLVELDNGALRVSTFYASPDPDWGSKEIDEDDIIIKYADLEDFRHGGPKS